MIEFDGGMLLVADAERLFLYNDSARRIWLALAAGLKPEEIAAALAETSGLDEAAVLADIQSIMAQWRADNLLGGKAPSHADAILPPLSRREPAWAAQWICNIRDRRIGFAVEDPKHAYMLKLLLGHLEVEDGPAEMRLEVRDAGDGRSAIYQDGRERARIIGTIGLRGTLHAAMIEYLWPERPISALVHGGAVAMGDGGVCFPAFAGSGKTTLIAYLIARGFSYFADDLTPIDASGCMLPWPTPLSVKEGSWPILEKLHPAIAEAPSFRTLKGRARLLMPPAEAANAVPTPVKALVFPRYQKGAATHLVALRPFQALERLHQAGIWLGHPLSEERIRPFLAWLGRTAAYALTYESLGEAERAIAGLVGAGGRPVPASGPTGAGMRAA